MIFFSAFQDSYLWLPLIGLTIGFFATMTGGGGGFFFPPVLILVFGIPAPVAVATSLAATLPICAVGSVGHYRQGNIDVPSGLVFVIAGITGALIGAGFTRLIDPDQLKAIFGIYLVILAMIMIISISREKSDNGSQSKPFGRYGWNRISRGSFFGFIGGTITGTFGTSGATPVQAGLFTLKIPIRKVVGTSLMVVLVNTFFALTGHFLVGRIDLTLLLFLTSGTLIGAFAGPILFSGLKIKSMEGSIRKYYAYLVFTLGLILVIT